MTTVAQLTIEMAANVARLRTDMDAARRTVDGAMGKIGQSAQTATRLLGGIGSALAVVQLGRQYLQLADAVTTLENRFRLTHDSIYAQGRAYRELFEISQRSRVSFTELGATYSSIARNGGPQTQVLKVTEAISNAMVVSGGSADSMKAALIQLGQGMASGVLRGEELNSVMEQTPRLAKAIADGLGITLGQLRAYGADGKLTAQAVTDALLSQADVLKNEVGSATLTVAQANTVLGNSVISLIGTLDKATAASSLWARSVKAGSGDLDLLSGVIERTAKDGGSGLMQLANAVGFLAGRSAFGALEISVNSFNWTVNALTGNLLGLDEKVRLMPDNLKSFEDQQEAVNRKLVQARDEYDRLAERLAKAPDNIYIKSELHQLFLYINKLQEAKAAQASLTGVSNPASYSNEDRREASRLAVAKAAAEREAARLDLLKKYATPVEKMNAELDAQRAKLGALFTPELEARIRANFEKPAQGAAAASRAAISEASRAEAEALRRVIDIAAERNRQFDEEFAASERQRMTVENRIKAGREMLATIELETRMLSMSREERELTTTLLELERQGIVKGTEAYAAYGEAIKKALGEKQAQEALIKRQEATKALAEEEKKENARRTATLAQSIEDGILTGFRNGQSFADVFLNELKAQFAKTVLRPMIEPIAAAGNALITSLFASVGFPSFAGGGYTGNGSRSGGMDGQGGYLAMLHPRETVVDHAKGQGAGQSISITINNTIGNVASQADVVGGMQAVRAQIMGELSRSMRYGGAAA